VVRPDAPVGQTPLVRAWWTRDHRSAIRAISPAGKRSCHRQDGALNAAEVSALLEPRRREVPGRLVLLGDGSPIHRRQTVQAFLTNGAAPRRHWERLPAYAPALKPDEGLGQQRTGVEPRHLCGVHLPHVRRELRAAVTRVRRQPRLITSVVRGAKL
jgi:hypothetical protein